MMKGMKQIFAVVTAVMLYTATFSGCAEEARPKAVRGSKISAETAEFYETWKQTYVTKDPYVSGEMQYYVRYTEDSYAGDSVSVPVTVSEAHGYGMLIFACLAQQDAAAKTYFDGMYRFYQAHPSDIGPHLMSWQQSDNGSALIDGAENGSMTGGSCDSATDGDMDIAYALLLADQIWGSDGEIDYLRAAKDMLADIMQYEVNAEYGTLTLGDWVSECEPTESYYGAVRTSDFIMQYLPVFAAVSGDENWNRVYENTYQIIADATAEQETGLLPDFLVRRADGSYAPAEADFLEGVDDGHYSYNSCRTPWRISMDDLFGNSSQAKAFAEKITKFMQEKTGGDPEQIMAGYDLAGNALEDYADLCFLAPFLVAAKCTDQQEWHEALRRAVLEYEPDVYYGDTIKLLCLLADDGAWPVPQTGETAVSGDVNGDGVRTLADAVMFQKYLLCAGTLTCWENADLLADMQVNGVDFTLLRQLLRVK